MGIIPKVRNTKSKEKIIIIINKYTIVSRKQFGANEVGLGVKRRFDVLYVQHLEHQFTRFPVYSNYFS